jgi:hypothetical protein
MPITRAQIERALNDVIAHEEGFRFQSLGVILATQKCGKLVAHEKKADLGLDAYAPGIEFADHSGRGAACSLTATLSKVRKDIKEAQIARELERGNRNRATLAVARKMVCYMLAVERRQQDFVPAEVFSRTVAV